MTLKVCYIPVGGNFVCHEEEEESGGGVNFPESLRMLSGCLVCYLFQD